MKYLLFSGCDYYPEGGAFDIDGVFDNLELAKNHVNNITSKKVDWANIINVDTMEVEYVFLAAIQYGWLTLEQYNKKFSSSILKDETERKIKHFK